jgi:hypothetical protein
MGGERRAGHPHPKRVYLAAPYTKGDVAVNVRTAVLAAGRVFDAGHFPYLPHLFHFWHMIAPRPYADWMILDHVWLEVCDVLIRLPGDSDGADAEDAYARELRIPVYYSVDEFLADHPLT